MHVRVMDNTTDTKCILFDTTATELIGQSANLLLNGVYDDSMQDPEKLPIAIRNLVGKTVQLLICVEKDNISGANDTYRVGKIWPGTDVEKIDDTHDSEGTTNSSQITLGRQDILMLTNSSEASTLSGSTANTPSSKRTKEEELEGSSTSKKICLKTIKLEKLEEKKNVNLEYVQEMKPKAQDPTEVETNGR
ncbi:hypothetical protein V5N11_010551 [Cardamine amara subsp. amara]|uniref:Uncharacterized protein n=1 Tax=Cardamine amara subsp. amara TaxID=228776 RepID=A0ABD1AX49_CARAN